ncbi:hypothetical protein MCOR25_001045 [Pyricularia grisea]|nr:hypothetical protein MCOR25_001045 [Pyricularia grisea]
MASIHCSPLSGAARRSAASFLLPKSVCRAQPIAPRPRAQPRRPVSSSSRRQYKQPADNPDFHSILDNPPELVRSGRRHGPGLIILAIIPLTAFGLGTWQVYRLQWKTDLLAKCEDRLVRPPLPLPPRVDPAAVEDFDYRRVYVTGRFRHDQEMLIGPRMRDGEQGYMVVTPLEPIAAEKVEAPAANGGSGDGAGPSLWQRVSGFFWRSSDSWGKDAPAGSSAPQVAEPPPPAVLVNRGWVSKKLGDQKDRPESLPEGPVTVEGMIRKPWKKNMFTPDNRPDIGEFYFPDVEQMASLTGSQPIWIESTMEPGLLEVLEMQRKGIPIGRAAEVNLRNNHAQYIFTWYALAAATSIMFYLVVKKPSKDVTRRVRKNYSW